MEKVYYAEPYLKELECQVVSVNKTGKALEVRTDKTIFYPECGGQPGDRGCLGAEKITDTVKADDGDSILILRADADIEVGKRYLLKLDWNHRYKYMIMHACQHMTSGLLFTIFNIGTVSVHLSDDYIAIETDQSSIPDSVIEELIETENIKISENHKIIYHEMSHQEAEALGLRRSIKVDGDVRIVEIEGVDRIACGGVHAASTSEIGLITYVGQEQIRGHVRLFFSCGENARNRAVVNQTTLSKLNEILSCSFEDLPKNVKQMAEDLAVTKTLNQNYSKKLAQNNIDKNIKNNVLAFEETEGISLQSYAACVPAFEDIALCITQKSNGKINWLIALKGKYEQLEFSKVKEKLFPIINAKGGGRFPIFQGIGTENNTESFLKEFENLLNAYIS